MGDYMQKKYHFEDTMMDERLIGEYKDEIKLEIAQTLGIELTNDAIKGVSEYDNLIGKTRKEIRKAEKRKK